MIPLLNRSTCSTFLSLHSSRVNSFGDRQSVPDPRPTSCHLLEDISVNVYSVAPECTPVPKDSAIIKRDNYFKL